MNKPAIILRQHEKILLFDGAMGTSIMKLQLNSDDFHGHDGCLEYLAVSRPDVLESIHAAYLQAGCDIIETNTLGAHPGELAAHGLQDRTVEINRKAAELAVRAADAYSNAGQPRYVAGSIGPGSRLPSLLQVGFDELEQGYYLQGLGLLEGGVDLFQIETSQDMLQIKAALSALSRLFREKGQERPVNVSVTVEKNRMLLGTDIQTALATFVPYRLFAFGINCGGGPEAMQDSVRILAAASPFPLTVMPNAGLPRFSNGEYVYDLQPGPFADWMLAFVRDHGVEMVGGCCGTTPAHLQALCRKLGGLSPVPRRVSTPAMATSLFSAQELRVHPGPLIIGEQTNATGSRKFREALLQDDLEAMAAVALEQEKEGAHLLDLNVAYAGRDEARDMDRLVGRLNSQTPLPLMLDSTQIEALQAGLKRSAGRVVINSINLEDGGVRAEQILALAKNFGAAVVCLAIDEEGMARTAEKKLAVLRRLHDLAIARGLKAHDLFMDPLTFTLASGDKGLADAGVETLAALPLIKKHLPGTLPLLGVSNISYGLQPAARRIVNAVFLYHAVTQGLAAAIFHAARVVPLNRIVAEEIQLAEDLIFNRRSGHDPLLALCDHFRGRKQGAAETGRSPSTPEESVYQAVLGGNASGLDDDLALLLAKMPALEIVNSLLLKAMAEVGVLFDAGKMQLPFVLKSAEVVKKALDILAPRMLHKERKYRGRMVLATVKGDVHDIGKNLVDIILSSNGYQVFNLGTNRDGEAIAAAVEEHRPGYLGLSALLVKSTLEMKEVLRHLAERNIRVPVICGGAAVTPLFVESTLQPESREKVHYCADAFQALRIMDGRPPAKARSANRKTVVKAAVAAKALAFDQPPLAPPFSGVRTMSWSLADVLPGLDRKTLVCSRWRMQAGPKADEFVETIVSMLAASEFGTFRAVYGYFPCRRLGPERLQLSAAAGDILLDLPGRKGVSLAGYFNEKGDMAPFFIVTCGSGFSVLEKKLFDSDQYQLYMLLHGFGEQLAETLAAAMHRQIRQELRLPPGQGKRYSPGFPAWPDLADQLKLVRLLEAGTIGVSCNDSFQLIPELSVSAMVVCHPQAEYL
ncbi:MAG TPA: homocysteine S-methyltransferase family protein [Candidatus Binatia bacterium]|nr:homocysteine S-methyltransferase family protein [Candidatus Binatia bacterium]